APEREDGQLGWKRWRGRVGHSGRQSKVEGAQCISGSMYATNVDERQFFTEKPEDRPASYQCPQCRRTNEYSIRWLRRTKKAQPPPGSDERARAMFNKVKDYLVRVDEHITCKTCRKRFEIPSHRNIVFLEELEGLPKDDYDE